MIKTPALFAASLFSLLSILAGEATPPAKPPLKIIPGQVIVPTDKMRRIWGELISVDLATRSGTFRKEGSDEVMKFNVMPYAELLHHAANGDLQDFKIGERAIFRMHENEAGEWVYLTYIQDQMNMMNGHREYFYVDRIDAAKGELECTQARIDWDPKLAVSPVWNSTAKYKAGDYVIHEGSTWQANAAIDVPGTAPSAKAKLWTEHGYMREKGILLETDANTRYWKNGEPATFADIKVGDKLRTKTHGLGKGKVQMCWEVFLDDASVLKFQNEQKAVHAKRMKEEGLPGYVDKLEDTRLSLTLFQEGNEVSRTLKAGQKVTVAPAGVNRKAESPTVQATVAEAKMAGNLCKLTLTLDAPSPDFKVTELARVFVTQ